MYNRNNYNSYQMDNMINEMLLNNINQNMNNNLEGSYDGYLKGNMYKNLYNQYKNYRPAKLIPNNEQAELLLNINQTTFALHDIRLYLDINPNDQNMIRIFNDYQRKVNNAINEYQQKYGPISMYSGSENNVFSWEMYNFPWEMEEI